MGSSQDRRMKTTGRNLLLMFIFVLGGMAAANADEDDQVFLEPRLENGMLTVIPWVRVGKAGQYRYVLESRVESRHRSSSAKSAGTVELPARLVYLQSIVRHPMSGPDEKFMFSLKLLKGAQLVAEDTLVFPEQGR